VAHLAADGEQARRERKTKLGTVGEQARRLGSDQLVAEVAQATMREQRMGNGLRRRASRCIVACLAAEGEQGRWRERK
jgi:hypothetical protein